MFKDMRVSQDCMNDFKTKPYYQGLGIELNVKILTTGNWPNDKENI